MNMSYRLLVLLFILLIQPVLAAQSPVRWTGGITQEERDAAPDDGTRLEFFVTGGNFLSAINVTVTDANGRELVNTETTGPWLILDLAPGTYRVHALRRNGDAQGGNITVTGESEKFAFMFPEE